MKTRQPVNAFILARQMHGNYLTGHEPGPLVTIAPRWVRGFEPCEPGSNAPAPESASCVRVHYADRAIEIAMSLADFLLALKAAGVKVIDARPTPEGAEAPA